MRRRRYVPATPCWAEVVTTDPDRSAAFYAGLFGWRPDHDAGPGGFRLGGLAVAGLAAGAAGDAPGWRTYVAVDDLGVTADLVAAAGGTALGPVTAAGAAARVARFSDPAGAVFGAWQRLSLGGAEVAGEPGATCWSELATADQDAAARFYGKVFGWTERSGEWMTPAGAAAAVVVPTDGPAHWRTTFVVDDCTTAAARCAALGGHVAAAPAPTEAGVHARLVDPLGAAFGVVALSPGLGAGMEPGDDG